MPNRLFNRLMVATLLSLFILHSALVPFSMASTKDSFVTGGGWITKNGEKVNFGFNAKYKADGSVQGDFNLIDRSTGVPIQIKSISLNWLLVRNANLAYFSGRATINRNGNYRFWVHVIDNGTPGTNDEILVFVPNMYFASGKLDGGNLEIHQ